MKTAGLVLTECLHTESHFGAIWQFQSTHYADKGINTKICRW